MNEVYNDKGHVIGCVKDHILTKSIRGSVHFLQEPPSIAWDVKALQKAMDIGATATEVVDTETRIVYFATIDVVWKHGIHINRGHSPQIALPFKRWAQNNPAQIQMF